ncbi:MAG: beta-lactamase family protein [Flavobacterium sp.]|nr:beta-lactamase family protein [Flavobacterium sp.]
MCLKKLLSFFIISLLFISCNSKEKRRLALLQKSQLNYAMHPRTDSLPKLTAEYVADKKNSIEHFFKKNWGADFENVSFLVAQNGQIIYEKYNGFADKENNILNSAETPLHIASVTKVLTASAILKLVDAKKLKLTDFYITYFPQFPYPDVTIKSLLNHRSGIRKYGYFVDDKNIWKKSKEITNQDILTILETQNITKEYKTDTHFSYCNTNYVLLALLIERITGMRYKLAMKKIIFQPLGMKNTFVFDDESGKETATPSYKGNYRKYAFDFLDAVYGDKNIYSTPRDLLKFDLARNAPDFLSSSLLKQMYKGYSYESKGTKNYGLGIRMHEWDTGQKMYYHNGWWHGNTSSYITLVNENAVIIALSNKFTHKTYKLKCLSSLFGDYPFKMDKDSAESE